MPGQINMFKSKGGDLATKGEAGAAEAGGQVVQGVITAAVSTSTLIDLKQKIDSKSRVIFAHSIH